ncbi:hypothetical protein RJ640_009863 [Escallonia rubra]|uniref:Uncharacterized protein n=1 Tax=Escallonia rubra TaxID=112253 RepID=A0AA88QN18_9ASTE|nr:hypothetical protein RJ640_009863 [Escallonia rubra]
MPGPVRKVLIDTILQRRARMLIHERKHVDPRQLSRLHQPLPLRLPKIRRHRDHRILHRHLRVNLCQLQGIPQNHSRQFLGRVNPLVGLNRGGAPRIFHGGERQRAARPAASSPIRRLPSWKATRAGDLRFDISLIATEIGVWPGFRFTTATFSHSEPRSMLDTAAWAWIEQSSSRDNPSPNLNRANDIFPTDQPLQPRPLRQSPPRQKPAHDAAKPPCHTITGRVTATHYAAAKPTPYAASRSVGLNYGGRFERVPIITPEEDSGAIPYQFGVLIA